jgi:hypothetical protein
MNLIIIVDLYKLFWPSYSFAARQQHRFRFLLAAPTAKKIRCFPTSTAQQVRYGGIYIYILFSSMQREPARTQQVVEEDFNNLPVSSAPK